MKVTRATLTYLAQAEPRLSTAGTVGVVALSGWYAEVAHYRPLIEQVIEHTERRVIHGESVPAKEKLFSVFETHTDIIKKRNRDIQYGHKLNLTSGKSGLILDVVVETGNPADSERFLPMLDRHIEHYGGAPKQMAADGGYASHDNLAQAKARGVSDMAFHKKCRLSIEGHGQKPLGVPEAAQLPRQHRGGHLVSEARLWAGTMPVEKVGNTSSLTSGPPWWPTISLCSPVYDRGSTSLAVAAAQPPSSQAEGDRRCPGDAIATKSTKPLPFRVRPRVTIPGRRGGYATAPAARNVEYAPRGGRKTLFMDGN